MFDFGVFIMVVGEKVMVMIELEKKQIRKNSVEKMEEEKEEK